MSTTTCRVVNYMQYETKIIVQFAAAYMDMCMVNSCPSLAIIIQKVTSIFTFNERGVSI